MFAKASALLAALLLAACVPATGTRQSPQTSVVPDPEDAYPATAAGLAAACEGRDGWSDRAPPSQIAPNVYYVGTCGITVLLLTSPAGHILIDAATNQSALSVVSNIRRLGFDPHHVRYLLTSHEHIDHVGALSGLQSLTGGAQVVARAEARAALQSGRPSADDPQAGSLPPFVGVDVARILADGEVLRLGPLELTVHATPGHTNGSTSWSWRVCEGAACRTIVYADSLTAVAPDAYRFGDHPEIVARFRATFDRVAQLDCDILITPHPSASNLFARLAGEAPLIDRDACRIYAAGAARRLDERLAREAAR